MGAPVPIQTRGKQDEPREARPTGKFQDGKLRSFRDAKLVAHWEEGKWPDPGFYNILNAEVRRCEVVNDRLIVFEFDNGVEMHLEDNLDQYESMQIAFEGDPSQRII